MTVRVAMLNRNLGRETNTSVWVVVDCEADSGEMGREKRRELGQGGTKVD